MCYTFFLFANQCRYSCLFPYFNALFVPYLYHDLIGDKVRLIGTYRYMYY